MRKKVYISGKIGEKVLSEATRQKFAKVEEWLKSEKYDTFNPTTSGLGHAAETAASLRGTTFYKEILVMDLSALAECDIICMIPDWGESPGAHVEVAYAQATGIPVKSLVYKNGEIKGWV